jgi:anti-anti-sigma factor
MFVVLHLIGALAGAEAAVAIAGALDEVARAGTRTLVLNFARVRAIDDAGLAGLLEAHTAVRATGAEVRLSGVSRRIGPPAVLAKLASTFKLFDSVDQAILGPISSASSGEGR